MIQINTDTTRYFKRDLETMKWDLSAYDERLLSSKYPLDQFKQFFAHIDVIPLPKDRSGCCVTKDRGGAGDSIIYSQSLNELTVIENNKIAATGLRWDMVAGPAVGPQYRNAIRNSFLRLSIGPTG